VDKEFLHCEFRSGVQDIAGRPISVDIVRRLNQSFIDAGRPVIEVQHRYSMSGEHLSKFVFAFGRDLQGEPGCLAVLTSRKVGIHLPRELRDGRVRIAFLSIGDANLMFRSWLLFMGHQIILQH
jgi:hypothetical protein